VCFWTWEPLNKPLRARQRLCEMGCAKVHGAKVDDANVDSLRHEPDKADRPAVCQPGASDTRRNAGREAAVSGEFLGVRITQGEPVTGRIQIPRIEMESDVKLITWRHVPSQIGTFTQIRIGFKNAARERPVLIIDESKLQQGKCLRIGSMIVYRGAQRYDTGVFMIRVHIG